MGFVMSNLMEKRNNNFASHYAAQKEAWEARLNQIMEDFMKK
jgi:hypothetical protein